MWVIVTFEPTKSIHNLPASETSYNIYKHKVSFSTNLTSKYKSYYVKKMNYYYTSVMQGIIDCSGIYEGM